MLANQIERDVYVLQNAHQQPIPYVRFTNAIPIVFNFRDYDIPEGSTVKAFCAKPSGAAVYSDDVSLSGNTVTITVSDQMFIELGITSLQVQVLNSGKNLVTFGWPVIVQPNYTEGDIPPSQNESGFWHELQQQVTDAVDNCNEAAASVNTAISNAEQATQTANNAAVNANEAAKQVFDQQYILTTDYTFPESGTVQPTSYGNAIVQEIDGAIYQGADPSPDNPQFIHGVGDTGFFDGELLQGIYENGVLIVNSIYVSAANKIPCNENDVVKVEYETPCRAIRIIWFDEDGTFISNTTTTQEGNTYVQGSAQTGSKYFLFSVNPSASVGTTPQTAGHITVTINGNYAVILDSVGVNIAKHEEVVRGVYYPDQGMFVQTTTSNTITPSVKVQLYNGTVFVKNVISNVSPGVQVNEIVKDSSFDRVHIALNGDKLDSYIAFDLSSISNGETVYAKYNFVSNTLNKGIIKNIFITKYEDADFAPYQSSRTYIPISSPIYSGDKIYQKEMQYRVSRQWGVTVFDGSEDEGWTANNNINGFYQFTYELAFDKKANGTLDASNSGLFSTIGVSKQVGTDTKQSGVWIYNGTTCVIVIKSDIISSYSSSALKTWLQSNPITVVYQLATPTDEPLSQDGIIAAYSLMACDEVTNVSLTGADPNLTLNNIVKFPRNSDGALLTTTRANGVMIELKDQNEDLTTITQQIATLNQFMASFDGKTLYTT